jgi:hypothetical protein
MQLYKSRDFSAFFADSFTFLKENGKHFFKHYFIINGALLIVLAALGYVFSAYFMQDVFNSAYGLGDSNKFESLVTENTALFILLIIAFVLIAFFFSAISYAYSPIYFKLYEKNNNSNFETSDIINSYKTHLSKIIKFVILGFLLAIPLAIAFGIAGLILTVTIIGISLLPLLVGLFSGLYNATFLEYLDNKRGFLDSFGYAWTIITSKFWPAVGCMGIFYVMAYIIQISLSIIQSAFNIGATLTIPTVDNLDVGDTESSMAIIILTAILYIISFVASFILNAILQINQSIVYYGVKEDNDNINLKNDIDLIGSSEA